MKTFRELLDKITEETAAADIASVEGPVDRRIYRRNQRCKEHKIVDCQKCQSPENKGKS